MNFEGPLEDRIAIRELLETYSDAVTRQDAEQWASAWLDSPEARWMLPTMAEWAQFVGKAQIVSEWVKMMRQFHSAAGEKLPVTQVSIPGRIVVDGDVAEVRCYTTECFATADGRTLQTRGQYDDVCVKQGGRWFFRERTWRIMHLGDHGFVQTDKAEA